MEENYNEWAIALTKYFFGPHMSGKRTRLTVNREFLNEEFVYLGGCEGFLYAVKNGPRWCYRGLDTPLHDKALRAFSIWKMQSEHRNSRYPTLPNNAPPYLPFLVLLCLAWTEDDDDEHLSGNSFYERLGLIVPAHGLDSQQLAQWKKLWDGLQDWTERLKGERGIWKLERVGQVHVGIPCSQTILTPCKLRRLPWLFHVTGLALLASRCTPIDTQVKAHLLQQESYTRSVLGNFLTTQIQDDTEIGKGVISLINEQLGNPENWIYEERPGSSKTTEAHDSDTAKLLPLRIALELKSPESKWHLRYCLLEENAPIGNNGGQSWTFTKKGMTSLGPFWLAIDADGPARVNESHVQPDSNYHIDYKSEDEDGTQTQQLIIRKRGIRIFRNWVNGLNYLFEEYDLPDVGGCYLLVHRNNKLHLDNWLKEFVSSGGRSTSFPPNGLPAQFELVYVDGIESSTKEILSNFPEKTAMTRKPSYLSFCGGSRIQGSGAERLYLTYDPPAVVLENRGDVSLHTEGAKLIEVAKDSSANNVLPGNRIEEFEIEIDSGTPAVTFEVFNKKTREVLETRAIGFTQHLLNINEQDHSENIRFDRFGQATDCGGISGCILESPEADAACNQYASNPEQYICYNDFMLKDQAIGEGGISDNRWNLVESLRLTKRITSREFRRRAESITGVWEAYSWSEARWLRAFCHIEIERDRKGRIAYIYPVKPCGYKLPWSMGNLSFFGVAGCPMHKELVKLQENAAAFECKITAYNRQSSILPPLLVIQGEEETIRLCLADAGFECAELENGLPDAGILACWAGSLADRCADFFWQSGYVQEPEAVFNPYCFRMLAPKQFSCPYKLYSIPDSYSPHNKWHAMMKTPGINDLHDEVRHVFLTDPSWGKWLTLGRASSGIPSGINCPNHEHTPIPYDAQRNELIVPASLRFPSMLTRALLLCSGLPPKIVRPSEYYSKTESPFLPDRGLPYDGTCYSYRLIPPQIAKMVCNKVSAWPVDLEPPKRPNLLSA